NNVQTLADTINNLTYYNEITIDADNSLVIGTKKADTLCWNNTCVYKNTSTAAGAVNLMSISLSKKIRFGKYYACFRLRSANNNLSTDGIKIEVLKNENGSFITQAFRNIKANEFTTTNAYQSFYVPFEYTGAHATNEEFKFSREDDNSIIIRGILTNIDRRREAENELKKSREQIEKLANHLEMVREEERKEFAREIHDEIGHSLTALKLDINLLLKKRFLREDVLEKKLNEMMVSIEQTIKTLQRISSQLRPSILDHFGLVAAIEWQAKEFQKQTGLRCKYLIPEDDIELSENKSIAIFRVFQEALTNIARHSKATRVDVSLEVINNNIELKVSDNGIGIKKEILDDPNSLGLLGMKERVNLIGGKISIGSVLNVGTTILINVPIN
ncbi:MAG TPA: sensor histidine kinase, partial [Bacteroidota bacterium]|nr:sensor histidine kinase [Bacteroidota bacterium]